MAKMLSEIRKAMNEIDITKNEYVPKYVDKIYSVYVLVKDSMPIYIGCTQSIEKRIVSHRSNKDFDEVMIAGVYTDRSTAFFHERNLIDFATKYNSSMLNIKKDYTKLNYTIKL